MDIECRKCRKWGHIAKECPRDEGDTEGTRSSNENSPNGKNNYSGSAAEKEEKKWKGQDSAVMDDAPRDTICTANTNFFWEGFQGTHL